MARRKVSDDIQEQVRQRANGLCEYCHASEKWQYVRFTVDHVIPINSGGSNDLNNLALACFHCNRRKWANISGVDPKSGDEVPLFNARREQWQEHFSWSRDSLRIIGLTPVGRATVSTLNLNRERIIAIRAADKKIGRHPPKEDFRNDLQT